ncbi:Spore coat protein CotH, partial [human gut metagenome]
MYVEAFSSSGELLVSQQAGARVAGAYSAAVDQKSWKLIARTMYTPDKGKFSYPFFSDATDENGAILTKIDRIVLRNGANDREFAGVRDELSMSLAKQSGYLDAQSTAPAAVFLNGKYYGFAWLHQNFSRAYLEERYGGTKDNYQVVGKAEGEIVDENAEGAADDYNKV